MRFPPHKPGTIAYEAAASARRKGAKPPLTTPQELTDRERLALRASSGKGGKAINEVKPAIRTRLVEAGWITQGDEVLLITRDGRAALAEVVELEEVEMYLNINPAGPLVSVPSLSPRGEPAATLPWDGQQRWRRRDREAQAEAETTADRRGTRGLRRQ